MKRVAGRAVGAALTGVALMGAALLGCASGGGPAPAPAFEVPGELACVVNDDRIVVLDAATGAQQELPVGKFHRVYWPSWSTDGSRLAFLGMEKSKLMDGELHMYVFNPNDSSIADLGVAPDLALRRRPIWSGTGATIYTRGDSLPARFHVPEDVRPEQRAARERVTWAPITDGYNLFLYDIPRDERWQVTELPITDRESILATAMDPDWRRLAFNVGQYLLTVDSTRVADTRYTADSDIHWVDWHPDGTRIFFLVGPPFKQRGVGKPGGTTYGVSGLYVLDLATGRATALLQEIRGDVSGIHPAVSGDGRFVALEHEVQTWRRVFAVSTEGLGAVQLNDKGVATYPAWRPMRAP